MSRSSSTPAPARVNHALARVCGVNSVLTESGPFTVTVQSHGTLSQKGTTMSTIATVSVFSEDVSADGAAIAARYGLPVNDSKSVQSHLKAVRAADKATLLAVIAEHGPALYRDPSALAKDVKTADDFAAAGRTVVDSVEAIAARLVMTARQVNPKASATSIGRAVEGTTPETEDSNFRQRWSRYATAAKMTAARAAAIKDGTTQTDLSVRQALTALQNSYVSRDELVARAADGRPMPTKGEADAAKGEADATPKAKTGADIVNAVTRLADIVKAADLSTLSADQSAEIARLMDSVRTRLSAK